MLPFLRHGPADVLVRTAGASITAAAFQADVAALARRLPDAAHVVNLCADRYRFTVGFAAALVRGQLTLLPSSDATGPLERLAAGYERLYFLHDTDFELTPRVPALSFPRELDGAAAPAEAAPVPAFPAEQPAAILFTSGSTGDPVPNPRSWGALVHSARAAGRALGLADTAGATILGTVPHQHSYGIESIVMLALQHGFAFHGARSLLPADIIADLAAMPGPRLLVTTPVHLRSLVAYDGALPAIRAMVSATAPLAGSLAAEAEARFQAPLYEIYGCSEIGQIAARHTVATEEWTCLDALTLEARGDEVWASGPAAANVAPLNDVIELRAPGRFLLIGRKSDMVNIAGKRSSLAYLNHRLNAVPGVLDGVFVRTTAEGRLAAYVVAPGLTRRQILAVLRRELDPAFLPRPLHMVEALPRNALGKLTRQALEQMHLEPVEH